MLKKIIDWFKWRKARRFGDWEIVGIAIDGTNVWVDRRECRLFIGDTPDA